VVLERLTKVRAAIHANLACAFVMQRVAAAKAMPPDT
jgi:hypothetical protein